MPVDDTLDPLIKKAEPEMRDDRYWRPWTLGRTAMISFIALCVGLLIANELAISGCRRHGSCHVFGHSPDGNMPKRSTLVYKTLPTILGIALSLRWILPHHDIMRLEPYFQMSTKYGAKASSSIFLQYPYDFVFWLPFKATLNEHYLVAFSSGILLLMNFVIVPLVPTMFDDVPINTTMLEIVNRVDFDPTARQVPANFTFLAYEHAWKHGLLNPFMTEEYALLPVKPLDNFPGFFPRENWTAETTLFQAGLDCVDARVEFNYGYWQGNNTLVVEMFRPNETSSPSVRVCDALPLEKGMNASYYNEKNCSGITAFMTPWTSMFWQLGNPEVEEVTYMFGWASGPSSPPTVTENFKSPTPVKITAMFCTPRYYTQSVNATVSMASGEVVNIEPIGTRKEIKALKGFDNIIDGNVKLNIKGEAIFVEPTENRTKSYSTYPRRFGYPPDKIIDLKYDLVEAFGEAQRPVTLVTFGRVSNSNIFMTRTDSLAAFALYNRTEGELGDLLDREELKSTMEKALKLWFACAVVTESAISNNVSRITVDRTVPDVEITVNKWWSLGARIGLPLVAILSGVLSFLIEKRVCHLNAEPNTIAASLRLLSASPALCAAMENAEYYKLKQLMEKLDEMGFYFRMDSNGDSARIRVFDGDGESAQEVPESSSALKVLQAPSPHVEVQSDCEFASPDLIATSNLVIFPILIAALIATYELSKRYDGFPMPSEPNSFWSKVCYNYLPTATGMLAETLLIVLGATQGMINPYRELIAQRAKYTETLKADHHSIPPHFQMVKTFKRGQFTLTALSVAILLSNALPVFLGVFFYHSIYVPKIEKSHEISNDLSRIRPEMFFQLDRNITNEYDYSPSWTTSEYYIDSPFKIAPISGEATYQTRGFGVDVICTLVPEDLVHFPCSTAARYIANRTVLCPAVETAAGEGPRDNLLVLTKMCNGDPPPGTIATWNGSCVDNVASNTHCPGRIFPMWVQNERYTVNPVNGSLRTEDNYQFVVLNCTLTNNIVDLSATVRDGKVRSLKNVHAVYPSSQANITDNLASRFAQLIADTASKDSLIGPHPLDRFSALMAEINQSVVAHHDSHVPSATVAVETFADLLKRLFPLLLRLEAERMFGVKYTVESQDYRAHVVRGYFGMTLGALVLCVLVIVKVYTEHTEKMMGHLPWSVAGMYSQLYASNAKYDINRARKELEEEELLGVYAYGEYPSELQLGKHYGVYKTVPSAV